MTSFPSLAGLRLLGPTLLAVALATVACGKKPEAEAPPVATPAPAASQPAAAAPTSALAQWPGTWTGPEGTYLKLVAQGDGKYEVAIRNLDGERKFAGTASNSDRIAFERDGKQEEIRATDGNATGMKWLAGKTTCLTVRAGEGYCRE